MALLGKIFTWWEGATIGTAIFSRRHGVKAGTDSLGNTYYCSKQGDRRWVIYKGANDAARIPPEWYSWLHHQIENTPDKAFPPPPKFLKTPTGNPTGTASAYRPAGALERGGRRQAASGDYEAWTPN